MHEAACFGASYCKSIVACQVNMVWGFRVVESLTVFFGNHCKGVASIRKPARRPGIMPFSIPNERKVPERTNRRRK